MAYKKSFKRFRGKGKIKTKKVARASGANMSKLQTQINRINKRLRREDEYINLGQWRDNAQLVADYVAVNLSNFNSMDQIFGTSTNDTEANKMIHKSFGLQIKVALENQLGASELLTTGISMFLVSLKDEASSIFNPATGALSLGINSSYYTTRGYTLLNKKYFNIHKKKFFSLTNHGSALIYSSAQTKYGSNYECYWKWRPNKVITNPTGDVYSLQSALDPSKQYYLLIFNNNSNTANGSPTLTMNAVHTIKVLG